MNKVASKNCNKNVNIVLSNTYLSGYYRVIDEIADKLKEQPNSNIILVVPDKFSLNAEQIFMERTGLSSVFNVWITTLSRFVGKVVGDDDANFVLLSKNSGTMLVSKIILENIEKISTYKKIANNYSLAEKMYNVINLLKSSGVRPEELKNNFSNTNFGLKIKDIYLIYSEYEKYMNNIADAITRLEIFDAKVKTNNEVKNSDIYFAMFDSFTNVQLSSLANIAKIAQNFTISMCANTLQKNSYIYDNTQFQKLKNCFDVNHINYVISNTKSNGSAMQNYLTQNLFAISSESESSKIETDCIKLIEFPKIQDEIRYVANKIKYLVLENENLFDDINIAVNGLDDYKSDIQKIFDEYSLPYYIDTSRSLLEHYFLRTLFKIADFICGQKTLNNAVSIVYSPVFVVDDNKKYDFENYCKKYNILGNEFYKEFNLENTDLCGNAEEVRRYVFEQIKDLEKSIFDCKTEVEKKGALIEYLNNIHAKEIIDNLSQQQSDIVEKQIGQEVYEKFEKVLNEADAIIGENLVSTQGFFDMLKSCVQSVNLTTVPLKCDAVFVGDASQSTYYPSSVLFVLGATQSRMPSYGTDAGTITDAEIAILKANNNVSPTIKELNKREKFKLFNLLILPSKRLEITYSTLIKGQTEFKSEFVTAIQNIVLTNGLPIQVEKSDMLEFKTFGDTKSHLVPYMVGTIKNAVKLSKNKSSVLKSILEKQFDDVLNYETKQFADSISRYQVTNVRKKLFRNDKTKISQIERYFKCPFLQFVDYAIKPKDNPKFEIKSVDVGNILHEVAQQYVNKYIQNKYQFALNEESAINSIFDKVIKSDKYCNFAQNSYAIKSLKEEAVRFCSAIKNQIVCSDFEPEYTEKKFDNFSIDNGLTISGIVDRVDKLYLKNSAIKDDLSYFRIIDYKTGKDKFTYQDVYYGIKLQLLIYMQAISHIENSNAVATGYMPIKNKFNDMFDEEFESYKIDGITLKNDGMVLRLDKKLTEHSKSNVINVEFKKDGDYTAATEKFLLNKNEFFNIQKYALLVLNGAVNEMLQSYILPKPYKVNNVSPCDTCKYKSICHYQIDASGYRKLESIQKNDVCKDIE